MDAVHVPLRPARVRRAQLLHALSTHGPAAAVLVGAGLRRLDGGARGTALALAVAEVLVGLWQGVVLARELRESSHLERAARAARRGDAIDHATADAHGARRLHLGALTTAVLLAVETWHHWHDTGHVTRPWVLGALAFLALGLGGHRWIATRTTRLRRLTLDAQGVELRTGPLVRRRVAWRDVVRVDASPTRLRFERTDGGALVFDAADYDDGLAALRRARAALAHTAPERLRAAGPDPRPTAVSAEAPASPDPPSS